MLTDPSQGAYPRLAITVDGPLVAEFFLLLQQGVMVRRRVGVSVYAFLRQEIGAAPETIEKIQSIMLDGKPVDDIGSSLIHEGSTLALSAAMPGLVGATLRRGGAYSTFRSAISYHESGNAGMPGEGWVCIKIFNLLMAVLGPGLLQQGVLIKAADLPGVLAGRTQEFLKGCRATIDGRTIDTGMLGDAAWSLGAEQVFLTVAAGRVEG